MATLLAIGTAKGLFLATSDDDRRSWEVTGPHFPMTGVYAVAIDTRGPTPRLLAGMTSSHFGPSVATSDDLGATWHEPDDGADRVPRGHRRVARPGLAAAPGRPERARRRLGRHASRSRCCAVHRRRRYASSWSAACGTTRTGRSGSAGFGGAGGAHGAARTRATRLGAGRDVHRRRLPHRRRRRDVGAPGNTGIRRRFLPDHVARSSASACTRSPATPATPTGCTRRTTTASTAPTTTARTWTSIADGLPTDFGFPMVAHPRRAGVVWTSRWWPTASGSRPTASCRVYRTDDAGGDLEPLVDGLPDGPVLPGGAARRDVRRRRRPGRGLLRHPRRRGLRQRRRGRQLVTLVAAHLPDVLCVRAADV